MFAYLYHLHTYLGSFRQVRIAEIHHTRKDEQFKP